MIDTHQHILTLQRWMDDYQSVFDDMDVQADFWREYYEHHPERIDIADAKLSDLETKMESLCYILNRLDEAYDEMKTYEQIST